MPSITTLELDRLRRAEKQARDDRVVAEQRRTELVRTIDALRADLDRVRRVAMGLPIVENMAQWSGEVGMVHRSGQDFGLTVEARLQLRLDRATEQAQELERRLAAVVAAVDMARAR